jgi:hypothetical protein
MTTPRSYYRFKPYNGARWLLWGLYALLLFVAPRVWSSGLGQTLLSQVGIGIIACLAYNVLLGFEAVIATRSRHSSRVPSRPRGRKIRISTISR